MESNNRTFYTYVKTDIVRVRICKPFKEPGNDSQLGGTVRQPYLTYRPVRLHRLAESIPSNRYMDSLNIYKYGLWLPVDRMPYEDESLLECASRRFVVGIISRRHDELNPVDQAPVQLLPANQVHPYSPADQ
jgi:hypothetical protein